MVDSTVTRIEVRFERSSHEATELLVTQRGEGLYEVMGEYRLEQGSGFPSHEVLQRSGGAFADRIEELRQKLVIPCRLWYHHYCHNGVGKADRYYESSWSIRIVSDGFVECWEGRGCAPNGLNHVYQDLVSFGMPGLRLGYCDSFESVCAGGDGSLLDPWHITSYEKALASLVQEIDAGGEEGPDTRLLAEFVDDVDLYLRQNCAEALDATAYAEAWKMALSVEALSGADVRSANRRHMMLLFGALTRAALSRDDLACLVRNGTIARWCARLREIPAEEYEEKRRAEHERRLALAGEIDASVRKHVAAKTPFTSHDVAKDCGVTAQQASTRIRYFVQRGELKPLEGSLPRKYRAA